MRKEAHKERRDRGAIDPVADRLGVGTEPTLGQKNNGLAVAYGCNPLGAPSDLRSSRPNIFLCECMCSCPSLPSALVPRVSRGCTAVECRIEKTSTHVRAKKDTHFQLSITTLFSNQGLHYPWKTLHYPFFGLHTTPITPPQSVTLSPLH